MSTLTNTRHRMVLLGVLVYLLSPQLAPSAQSPCDRALIQEDGRSISYQPRGNRCEGTYKRLVSSFGVQLISLTAQSKLHDLCASGQTVHLAWPSFTVSTPIRLRAESLRPQLYYRLDVAVPPNASSFEWAADPRCSPEVRLSPEELGVTAIAEASLGRRRVDALLPVGFFGGAKETVDPPYRALLMPGRRVREVYVSLWQYSAQGVATGIVSERPLAARPYSTGRAIPIELAAPDLRRPGLYRFRASVEFESGDIEAIDFHFVHGSRS